MHGILCYSLIDYDRFYYSQVFNKGPRSKDPAQPTVNIEGGDEGVPRAGNLRALLAKRRRVE